MNKIEIVQKVWLEKLEKAARTSKPKPFMTIPDNVFSRDKNSYGSLDNDTFKLLQKKSFTIRPEDIDRLLENRNPGVVLALSTRDDLSKPQIESVLSDPNSFGDRAQWVDDNGNKQGYDYRVTPKSKIGNGLSITHNIYHNLINTLITKHGVSLDRIHHVLLRKGSSDAAAYVARQIPHEKLETELNDTQDPVKKSAVVSMAGRNNITDSVKSKLAGSTDPRVIAELIDKQNLGPEQNSIFLHSPNPDIRQKFLDKMSSYHAPEMPTQDVVDAIRKSPDNVRADIFHRYTDTDNNRSPDQQAEILRLGVSMIPDSPSIANRIATSYKYQSIRTPEVISSILRSHGNNDDIVKNLIHNSLEDVSPEQQRDIIRNDNLEESTRSRLFDSPHISSGDLAPFLNSENHEVLNRLTRSPHLTHQMVGQLFAVSKARHALNPVDSADSNTRQKGLLARQVMDQMLVHPNAPDELRGSLTHMSQESQIKFLRNSDNISPENLQKLAASPSADVRKAVAGRKDLTPETEAQLRGDKDIKVRKAYYQRKLAPSNHRDPITASGEDYLAAVRDKASTVRKMALESKRITPEALTIAAKSKDLGTALLAVKHKNISPSAAQEAMSHKEMEVRLAAHHTGKVNPASSEQLFHALEPKDQWKFFRTSRIGESRRNIPDSMIEKIVHNPHLAHDFIENDKDIKRLSPNQTASLLDTLADEPSKIAKVLKAHPAIDPALLNTIYKNSKENNSRGGELVAAAAMSHPNISDESMLYAINNNNADRSNYDDMNAIVKNPRAAANPAIVDAIKNNTNFYDSFITQNPGIKPEHLRDAWRHADSFGFNGNRLKSTVLTHHEVPSDIILQAVHPTQPQDIQRRAAELMPVHMPDEFNASLPHSHTVEVNPAVEKLKYLKGLVQDQPGGTINKRDVKSKLNIQEVPNQILDPKGNITPDSIDKMIHTLPKAKYNVSYSTWGSSQRHDPTKNQHVLQLNLTNEQVQHLKDKGLYSTFRKVQDMSYRSGHPVRKHTLGWSRIDLSQPGHAHIDEVQSDLGQGTIRRILQAKEDGSMNSDEADKYVGDLKEINKYLSGGHKTINHAILSAVHQTARERGFPAIDMENNAGSKVSVPEVKDVKSTSMDLLHDQAKQSSQQVQNELPVHMQQTYEEFPRQMGYVTADKKTVMPDTKAPEKDLNFRKLTKSLELIDSLIDSLEFLNVNKR